MYLTGLIIGLSTFVITGIFHPVVIKMEYHFSKRCWPLFLLLGLVCVGLSLAMRDMVPSALLGVLGFSFLWCIRELFEQEERVRKGWFPSNPDRVEKSTIYKEV